MTRDKPVSILILGAGWTSTFLIPLLAKECVSYAATTTTGRDGTIKFFFDPSSDSEEPYKSLPSAQTVLITFPLKGKGQSKQLHHLYSITHPTASAKYIQLGSTGIFSIADQTLWVTRHSAYNKTDDRAIAEDELMALGGCVLNLSGLWGGSRQARHWVNRVASTKTQLKGKTSLHMIHGEDVSRAILAISRNFTPRERWMLTDLFVYDWWALILGWGHEDNGVTQEAPPPQLTWIQELMVEDGIRALPRSMEQLGRCYDTREFWAKIKIMPRRARL